MYSMDLRRRVWAVCEAGLGTAEGLRYSRSVNRGSGD